MSSAALAVALGGATGAVIRYHAVAGASAVWGGGFPYGTLIVNVFGSFLIGLIMEASTLKLNLSLEMRALLVTGFLGGFTTFSAYALDIYKLTSVHDMMGAMVYMIGSVVLSVLAVFGGVYLARGMV